MAQEGITAAMRFRERAGNSSTHSYTHVPVNIQQIYVHTHVHTHVHSHADTNTCDHRGVLVGQYISEILVLKSKGESYPDLAHMTQEAFGLAGG